VSQIPLLILIFVFHALILGHIFARSAVTGLPQLVSAAFLTFAQQSTRTYDEV